MRKRVGDDDDDDAGCSWRVEGIVTINPTHLLPFTYDHSSSNFDDIIYP